MKHSEQIKGIVKFMTVLAMIAMFMMAITTEAPLWRIVVGGIAIFIVSFTYAVFKYTMSLPKLKVAGKVYYNKRRAS